MSAVDRVDSKRVTMAVKVAAAALMRWLAMTNVNAYPKWVKAMDVKRL